MVDLLRKTSEISKFHFQRGPSITQIVYYLQSITETHIVSTWRKKQRKNHNNEAHRSRQSTIIAEPQQATSRLIRTSSNPMLPCTRHRDGTGLPDDRGGYFYPPIHYNWQQGLHQQSWLFVFKLKKLRLRDTLYMWRYELGSFSSNYSSEPRL